ncbi:MAG: peptidylprolyl isomerase, partial [Bacteroidota bacterium]
NRQKGVIFEEAKITPREVKQFFASIPKDSLGLLPAEVQLNHIVVNVPWSEDSKDKARKELVDLRKRIADGGEKFADLARRYSEDPGSRPRGGSLGSFGRGMMVPKFEEIAYSMREGDVSDVFETEFGFHVIQLHKRQGELVQASHILRKPKPSIEGDSIVQAKFDEIRELIDTDSLSFEEAAIRYSQDRASKDCGGCISNPKAPGELDVPLDALPADMYFKVESMEAGQISDPMKIDEISGGSGRPAYHIIYLKKKIPPHAPNLQDDYKTIYNAALRARQGEILDNWVETAKKNIYIDIKPNECSNALKNWIN